MSATASLLKNRYRLHTTLSRQDITTTYLASDQETASRCVIKELALERVRQWKTIELMEREAKVLSQLDHPRIPKFIDLFTVEEETSIRLYLVQEHIEGKNLAEHLQEKGSVSEKQAIDIAIEVAEILEYIHRFSPPFIHRDIKPSNILVTPENQIYLVDFGAVRDKLMQDERASGGGSTVVGSYGYTPFEQFSGRALPASDIYSLGVTLIQLLSGKDPARLPKQQMRIDFREDIDPSAGLSLVLEKMIDPDWQRRYRSATALKKELVRVRRGELPSHGTSYKIKVVVATFLITFLLTTIFAGRIPIYSDYFARQLSTDEEQGENVARDKPENLYRRRFLCSQFVHSGMPRLGANLVKNPNLEGPRGWGFASGVEMRHLDSESPYSGEYSFALRKNDKAWQWVHPIWWNDFLRRQIEQKVYSIEVSARVRSSKGSIQGSPIVSVTLYEIIKPNPVTPKNYKEIKFIPIMELYGFPTAASTEWRERSMSWLLPPNAQHIKIYLERYTDKGDDSENIAFFDDIEVRVRARPGKPRRQQKPATHPE